MRPTSTRLREIVRSTHTSRARVTLLSNDGAAAPGPFQQSLTPVNGTRLQVLDGDVRMDSSAIVRSTIDVTVQGPWGGVLLPSGAELFVEYGVEVAGGQFEWTSLGYFRIEDVELDCDSGVTRITGSDRMAQVVDTEAMYPWVVPANISQQDFYSSLLFGRNPAGWFHLNGGVFPSDTTHREIVCDYAYGSMLTGSQVLLEESFQKHMQDMATRYRKRLFFDYRGRLNIVDDVVAPAPSPVRTISSGGAGGLRKLKRRVTRDGVYNSVVAKGDQPTEGDPPWGYAAFYGSEPSGLDWFGEFGRILRRYSSPLIKTGDAAEATANSWLRKVRGLPYTTSFSMPADPTLEPLDTVDLVFPEQLPGADSPSPRVGSETRERHVIDTLTFPLTGGDMSVTTRGALMNGHRGLVIST